MADSIASIDYTSKDYAGFREAMLDYAAQNFPEWTGRNAADFGVLLVETFAYAADILSYYQDVAAREAYLDTASQRSSVLALSAMLGYVMTPAAPATGSVVLSSEETQEEAVTVPPGTQVSTEFIEALDAPLIYETLDEVVIPPLGGAMTVDVIEGQTIGDTEITLYPDTADETQLRVESLGLSTGLASQRLFLASKPVLGSTIRLFADTDNGPIEWTAVATLLESAPTDRAFSTEQDADGATSVVLGDGLAGLIPEAGQALYAAYRVGGGARGNVAAGQIVDLVEAIPGVVITTSSAMTGGRDVESTESMRRNAPRVHRTQDRAVSLRDYEDLALAVQGNAKASAVGEHFSSVNVHIVGPNNVLPNENQLTATTRYIQDRALTGVWVKVLPGDLIPINIGRPDAPVVLGLYPNFRRSEAILAAKQVLQRLLSSEESDFGLRIPLSRVYSLLDEIPGVEYVNLTMLARADAAQTGAGDIVCREWEIPVPGSIYVVADGGI